MTRVDEIKAILEKNHLDGILITNPIDLYYFTGFSLSAGNLLITHDNTILIVDGRYFESIKNNNKIKTVLLKEGVLENVFSSLKTIGVDSETTTLQEVKKLETFNLKVKGIDSLSRKIREVKTKEEISLLKASAELALLGFDHVVSSLKEGVLEKELALELEWFWRKKGASGPSFLPIIAFQKNSALPHYRAGESSLKNGDVVLIDIGVTLNNYQSDMTRVVFFGNVDRKAYEVRRVVEEAMNAAKKLIKPGTPIKDLDLAAREVITKNGYGENFTHSLGHGVGLEIHENPTIRKTTPNEEILKPGMVITIEPGIYIPEHFGVRLEDTIVVTDTGFENLITRPYLYETKL